MDLVTIVLILAVAGGLLMAVTASLNRTPLCRFSIEPIIQRLAVKHFFL
jgi:hypothetical protein